MPYIHRLKRELFRKEINSLVETLLKEPDEFRDGEVNYIITSLLKRLYLPTSYQKLNAAIGILECAKLEMYRRVTGPYEDKKIEENGDV